MITISLNEIRKHRPCQTGWEKLLNHVGKTKADDEKLPFRVIIDSNGLDDAIWALRCLDDQTPARLFAVACAQEVMGLMEDERSVECVMVAHLFAHGEVDNAASAAAWAAAWAAARDAARDAASAAARASAWAAARAAAWAAAWAAASDAESAAARAAESAAARDAASDAALDVMHKKQRDWLIAIVENYAEDE